MLETPTPYRNTPPQIDDTLSSFQLRGAREICDFLVTHPEVRSVLDEGRDVLRRVFGPAAFLSLELFKDPEGTPGKVELWIMVQCHKNVESSLTKLRQLDEEWLVRLPRHLRDLVNVDVEFVEFA